MAFSDVKTRRGFILIPNGSVSGFPGLAGGQADQVDLRLRDIASPLVNLANFKRIPLTTPGGQKTIFPVGGMLPYVAEVAGVSPCGREPVILSDGADGAKILTANEWGAAVIRFRDGNNYYRHVIACVDAKIRDMEFNVLTTLNLKIGEKKYIHFAATVPGFNVSVRFANAAGTCCILDGEVAGAALSKTGVVGVTGTAPGSGTISAKDQQFAPVVFHSIDVNVG